MDENVITDLKQFIATTISQQTSDLREDISGIHADISGLRKDISKIDHKIDDLSASVAEALDVSNEITEKQLKDHDRRITRLERGLAKA